jgi:hypothetical protein
VDATIAIAVGQQSFPRGWSPSGGIHLPNAEWNFVSGAFLRQPEDRQTAAIYKAVVRELFRSQPENSGKGTLSRMFLLYPLEGVSRNGVSPETRRARLTEAVRRGVDRGLADLPVWIIWLARRSEEIREPSQEYLRRMGIVVAFHGIRFDDSDTVTIEGTIERPERSSCGFTVIVENRDGDWSVKSFYQRLIH